MGIKLIYFNMVNVSTDLLVNIPLLPHILWSTPSRRRILLERLKLSVGYLVGKSVFPNRSAMFGAETYVTFIGGPRLLPEGSQPESANTCCMKE